LGIAVWGLAGPAISDPDRRRVSKLRALGYKQTRHWEVF
jgi:hypothetical protein